MLHGRLNDNWSLPSSLCPCAGIFSLSLIVQSGFFAVFKLASATQLSTEPKSQLSSCLSCWEDYYQWRCLPLDSPVALLLHWVLQVFLLKQLCITWSLIWMPVTLSLIMTARQQAHFPSLL